MKYLILSFFISILFFILYSISNKDTFIDNESTLVIASDIQEIENGKYANKKDLTHIDFSNALELEELGQNAFSNTSIMRVDLPPNLKKINNAFSMNSKLTDINFGKVTLDTVLDSFSERQPPFASCPITTLRFDSLEYTEDLVNKAQDSRLLYNFINNYSPRTIREEVEAPDPKITIIIGKCINVESAMHSQKINDLFKSMNNRYQKKKLLW